MYFLRVKGVIILMYFPGLAIPSHVWKDVVIRGDI